MYRFVGREFKPLERHTNESSSGEIGRAELGMERKPSRFYKSLATEKGSFNDLLPQPLATLDFVVYGQLIRLCQPQMRFVYLGSRVCLQLPSDSASQQTPLLLATVGMSPTPVRDFHPIENRPCRAYTEKRTRLYARSSFLSSKASQIPFCLSLAVNRSYDGLVSRSSVRCDCHRGTARSRCVRTMDGGVTIQRTRDC